LIQAASRALSSSASSIPAPAVPSQHDGAGAERERRVQTTKVPAVGAASGSPAPTAAGSADADARARGGVTRQVSRPHFGPAASGTGAPVIEDEAAGAVAVDASSETAATPAPAAVSAGLAGLPNRLLALVAALILVAFALGFVVGLIVH
jgi:hypothetical protein